MSVPTPSNASQGVPDALQATVDELVRMGFVDIVDGRVTATGAGDAIRPIAAPGSIAHPIAPLA